MADFYCAESRLVVEVDGGIHDIQEVRDRERDLILESKGMSVLRIKNEELSNLGEVERKIRHVLLQSGKSLDLMSSAEKVRR